MENGGALSRRRLITQALLLPPALAFAGCGGGGGSTITRTVSGRWAEVLLDAISNTSLGPPQNARAIAIVQTAAFDAWACYDSVAVGTRLGGSLRRPVGEQTQGNKEQAISFAAYRALVDLYPSRQATFDGLMRELGYDPANTSLDTTTAVGIGNRCAQALLEYRHTDGSNQLNNYADTTGYVPVNGPDTVVDPKYWQQIRFPNGSSPAYIAPHWGLVTPFALSSSSQLRAPAPPEYGSAAYIAEMNEVIQLTIDLTSAQRSLVEYWADGPRSVQPPGHWMLFALSVSARDSYDLDRDVKLFFIVGNAVMDAGIGCWETKRFYNTSRPITAIRALSPGNQNWGPSQSNDFQTPPFPEYTSGHSTFSAAAAEVLKRFTGSDTFSYTPKSRIAPLVSSWTTFSEVADQAGLSRRYGGIHFESADLEGRKMGRTIGGLVWDKTQQYINGTAV
ncbi:vanadium-dependent haloperoxidase [Armatimonas sp.]|uniref:vanadium-dependent haloperoxidase n=1 Tax=Armatimonas sp. TaxID=1872638 RepID=UPI00286A9007|nr:vanadium-dependent haloperoxidase [Armatimonas sp.]